MVRDFSPSLPPHGGMTSLPNLDVLTMISSKEIIMKPLPFNEHLNLLEI